MFIGFVRVSNLNILFRSVGIRAGVVDGWRDRCHIRIGTPRASEQESPKRDIGLAELEIFIQSPEIRLDIHIEIAQQPVATQNIRDVEASI